jgi:pSer/pThr/pTyr-binding forkhead associated (FHA) protein
MPADSEETSDPGTGVQMESDARESAVADLIVIRPDGTEGASIPLPDDSISLGRSSQFDVLNEDPFLSPTHATLTHRSGKFMVRDEDSLNGIFFRVDGEVSLEDGDHIRIGQELMRFRTMDEPDVDNEEGTKLAGSPDPGCWGRLEVVAGPDVVSRSFALIDDTVTMGREEGKIVFRDDGFVSGTHADIRREDGEYVLRDLDSSNGTYVRIREERPLREGDLVLMGQQLFRLELR